MLVDELREDFRTRGNKHVVLVDVIRRTLVEADVARVAQKSDERLENETRRRAVSLVGGVAVVVDLKVGEAVLRADLGARRVDLVGRYAVLVRCPCVEPMRDVQLVGLKLFATLVPIFRRLGDGIDVRAPPLIACSWVIHLGDIAVLRQQPPR